MNMTLADTLQQKATKFLYEQMSLLYVGL